MKPKKKNKSECFPERNKISYIKWMRHLIPQTSWSDTLTNLLLEKEQKQSILLRILDNSNWINNISKNNTKRENQANKKELKPYLWFSKDTLEKIYHIRDIFLQFDEDRSRTLEISEWYAMFNTNDIPITTDELVEWFSDPKDEVQKNRDYKLSFLDFVNFAWSDSFSTKFRMLMKRIKERNKDKNIYWPISFSGALEYIYQKGKVKRAMKRIENGVRKVELFLDTKAWINLSRRGSILQRIGVGKDINVKTICSGFQSVINVSNEQLRKIETSLRANDMQKAAKIRKQAFSKQQWQDIKLKFPLDKWEIITQNSFNKSRNNTNYISTERKTTENKTNSWLNKTQSECTFTSTTKARGRNKKGFISSGALYAYNTWSGHRNFIRCNKVLPNIDANWEENLESQRKKTPLTFRPKHKVILKRLKITS